MDAQTLLNNLATVAGAPGGIQRLRDLVLALAVSGRLVESDPTDEPVADHALTSSRERLLENGAISKPRHPEGVPVVDPPYEIPGCWRWLRLGDVGAVVGGGTPKSTEPRFWSDEPSVPWVTPADMRSQGPMIFRGARDITPEGLAKSSAQLLPAGSVLFSSRAPIGHVGIAAQPLATNQGFKSCVPYLQEMTHYLYVFLQQVGPSIDATATGTTFKEVSGKDVSLIPVPIPPIAEQERIVAKVNELMELCDDLEALQVHRHHATTRFRGSALDALAAAESVTELRGAWERLSKIWATVAVGADDVGEIEATILQLAVCGRLTRGLDELDEASTRRSSAGWSVLPHDWEWRPLQSLVDPDRSISYGVIKLGPDPGPSGVPILRCSNVRRMWIDQVGVRNIDRALSDEYRRTVLRGGEHLVNVRGTLGGCAIVPDEMSGFNVAREVAVVPTVGIDVEYLLYVLASPGFLNYTAASLRGTAYQGLNLSLLRAFPVPVPPPNDQAEIVARVREMLGWCGDLAAAGEALTRASTALSRSLTADPV